MRKVEVKRKPSVAQVCFYCLVFLIGLILQPNWVFNNFWARADFYESIPFEVPYLGFALIYSTLSTYFVFICVKLVKRFL